MKKEKQTVNSEIKNYIHDNAKRIINTLVKLNCNQEKISVDYIIKEKIN